MILNCFSQRETEKSLNDLSMKTGLHKSTVFRVMETLEKIKWVRKDPKTGTFHLGLAIFELGTRAIYGLDFYKASLIHLERLVKVIGQSAHLVIHDQGEVLYLNKVESPGIFITQPSQIGLRLPMHCTAVGKVLLSYMEEKAVENIVVSKGLRRFTDNTITSNSDLYKALSKTREEGYAIDNEEVQLGLRCVAAPIQDYTGKVVAAVSISGLVSRLSDDKIPYLVNVVKETGEKISRDLGCPDQLLIRSV